MKISFPKYGPGELLIKERGARCIISSVVVGFFAGLCASYLLQNKFWLLSIALVAIAGILLALVEPQVSSSTIARSTELPAPTTHPAPIAQPAPTSGKTRRDLHLSGIIGPANQFEHAGFLTVQAKKFPRS
jgi:hypothetical protein